MPQLPVAALALSMTVSLASGCADGSFIRIADDHRGFVVGETGRPFIPMGFNYDHDRDGRLIEDYWVDQWATVEADFAEMKELGANVVRVHLQFGRFMDAPDKPNDASLRQLARLVALAERTGLHLDVTGLGCYHKQDVPAWYDALSEAERWAAQAKFWEAVAATCADSPAIFCYDLMNEPVVPGGKGKRDDWLAGAFGGKHFVQFVALETAGRERHAIAKAWIDTLVAAVRRHDTRHLVTVGLVPWSLDRPGLTSGFDPSKVADSLDFIAVHVYPEAGKLDEAMSLVRGPGSFDVGKPIVVEETFALRCSPAELQRFMIDASPPVSGWIGFYWGATPAELRADGSIGAAITLGWLELFERRAEAINATDHP